MSVCLTNKRFMNKYIIDIIVGFLDCWSVLNLRNSCKYFYERVKIKELPFDIDLKYRELFPDLEILKIKTKGLSCVRNMEISLNGVKEFYLKGRKDEVDNLNCLVNVDRYRCLRKINIPNYVYNGIYYENNFKWVADLCFYELINFKGSLNNLCTVGTIGVSGSIKNLQTEFLNKCKNLIIGKCKFVRSRNNLVIISYCSNLTIEELYPDEDSLYLFLISCKNVKIRSGKKNIQVKRTDCLNCEIN